MQAAESAGASQEVAAATGPLPDLRPRAVRLFHESSSYVGGDDDDGGAVTDLHAVDVGIAGVLDQLYRGRGQGDGEGVDGGAEKECGEIADRGAVEGARGRRVGLAKSI